MLNHREYTVTQDQHTVKTAWSIGECITSKLKSKNVTKEDTWKERNKKPTTIKSLPWQCIVQTGERWGGSTLLSLLAHSQPLGRRILHHTPQLAFSSLGGSHCAVRHTTNHYLTFWQQCLGFCKFSLISFLLWRQYYSSFIINPMLLTQSLISSTHSLCSLSPVVCLAWLNGELVNWSPSGLILSVVTRFVT